jgi:lysophospholipase L1-like esterase
VIGELTLGENKLDKHLERFAAISRRVAEEEGATLCDLRVAFIDHLSVHNPKNSAKGILTTDGVHLNSAGNVLVAQEAAWAMVRAARARAKADPAGPQTKD